MWEAICNRLGTQAVQKVEEKASLSAHIGVFLGCHGQLHLRLPEDIGLQLLQPLTVDLYHGPLWYPQALGSGWSCTISTLALGSQA